MKRDSGATQLSAVFVDYDNIYLSLKRKNEEAAKRFSKDASVWLKALEKGLLIASNGAMDPTAPRRIVLNRCYGNPVPRRNSADNTTDMNSFAFVRHHFTRAGFEVVDCLPLTSQQKNAADIRMVMDLRDYLTHATYFDEFIILSGDADFTPVLHRLRQHARRTVIYSNDHTAAAYAAICDGEVRESDLIRQLLASTGSGAQIDAAPAHQAPAPTLIVQTPVVALTPAPQSAHVPERAPAAQLRLEDLRQMIMAEVVAGIRAASGPVPLEALADRAIRALGHERSVGTAWAGAGSFRELMRIALPADLRLTEQAPFHAYDPLRHVALAPVVLTPTPLAPIPVGPPTTASGPSLAEQREALAAAMSELTQADPEPAAPTEPRPSRYAPLRPSAGPVARAAEPTAPVLQSQTVQPPQQAAQQPAALSSRATTADAVMHRGSSTRSAAPVAQQAARPDTQSSAQLAMTRIQEAAQAPALSPSDYRVIFTTMAQEISDNGLTGAQTLSAIAERAEGYGVALRKEDIRFVLDVVSEPDPWFEQGATPTLFAGRFRNFVVARCRDYGLQLSAKDLDLIDAWIMGVATQAQARGFSSDADRTASPTRPSTEAASREGGSRWWAQDDATPAQGGEDDFPRIVRTRRRG